MKLIRSDIYENLKMAIDTLRANKLRSFLTVFGGKLLVSGGGKTSAGVSLQGTLPEFERAGTQVVSEGRFFSQFENDTNQNVCVIGSKVADDFFKVGSPVDQTIKIGSDEFRV